MGVINTQPFGLMRPGARTEARNAHLIPEIHRRAKRILHRAKEEEIISVGSLVRETTELWHQIKNGQPCYCGKIEKAADEQNQCECGVPDILNFLHSNNPTILNNKERCPICFGTGYLGGYEIQGCSSLVLSANTHNMKIDGNLSIECGDWYSIRCGNLGTVEWTVQLPKYYIKCHSIVAHWSPRPPHAFEIFLNGEDFDIDLFNLLGQRNKNEPVKISMMIEDSTGEIKLDYLRIMLQMNRNNMVMVDFPNYTYSYSGELMVANEVQSTVTANFDGRQKIETTDIFVLEKDGIAWRVFELEDNSPMGVTISQNAQARLIRAFEKEYLLPSKLMQKVYPLENYSFIY